MKKILITGTSGFIGKSLSEKLSKSGKHIRGTVRTINSFSKNTDIEYVLVEDISLKTNWKDILVDVDCIIHCAGRAHIMNEKKNDTSKIFQSVNVEGTKQLAEQASKAEVKRFIFLSSVKVNGECTYNIDNKDISYHQRKKIFSYNDLPNPQDSYAVSKFEAENALWEISSRTGLEVSILRLPLVYGYGAKGNLANLLKLVAFRIPLPLRMVKNQRSMIGIDNLVDLLITCVDHPNAAGKNFLVSDGEDLSTPDFIRYIANSMGHRARFFPIPFFLLKLLGLIFGKQAEINRLVGSLKIDSRYTQKELNWTPPLSVVEGIRRMIQGK